MRASPLPPTEPARWTRAAPLVVAILLLLSLGLSLSYWPGLMTWDAARQYGQAIDGQYDDWHPPVMEWLWRQCRMVADGPAPMLLLQLGLYLGGFALFAIRALRGGRPGLATAIAAGALLPLSVALMGAVLKDCLMAGALLLAAALLPWQDDGGQGWRSRLCVFVLLLFAAMLRFNAFLAALPLAVAILPAVFRNSWPRLAASALCTTALLIVAMPVANRLIGARSSDVAYSLVIFDLAGMTDHAGVDLFPPMAIRDPVAVNHRCYRADKWDSYSWWVEPLCPIRFDTVRAAFVAQGLHPYAYLARSVLRHPVAYIRHRLAHFNLNTRFLVRTQIDRPVQAVSAPNEWDYVVDPNRVQPLVDRIALASAVTPLGWPIAWIALAFGLLLIGPGLPSRAIIVPLALSALLYGLGYGLFSVASELRYHLWTMTGTLMAMLIAGSDLRRVSPGPRRMAAAFAPLGLVLLIGMVWRYAPIP
jgi:hypothetical protein